MENIFALRKCSLSNSPFGRIAVSSGRMLVEPTARLRSLGPAQTPTDNQWFLEMAVCGVIPSLSCLYCPESGRTQVHIAHKFYPFRAICTQTAPEREGRLETLIFYMVASALTLMLDQFKGGQVTVQHLTNPIQLDKYPQPHTNRPEDQGPTVQTQVLESP